MVVIRLTVLWGREEGQRSCQEQPELELCIPVYMTAKKRVVNDIIWCHETYDWGNIVSRDENILKTTMRHLSVTNSTSKTCNM